jgi:cell division septum initiation protein DivIVA
MRLASYLESFSDVSQRLDIVARLISAQEWLLDGYDRDEILGLLGDLERDVQRATRENEQLEEAA